MDRSVLSRAARVLALVATAAVSLSGGVKQLFPTAIFTFEKHPDLPLRSYAEGRLGIVRPTYARSYLYVAYRWIDGAPMTAEEVDQLDGYWRSRLSPDKPATGAAEAYDAVRGAIDIPWQAPEKPNGYAASQYLAVDYVYYSKCSDDAFATAAETLKARMEAFGKESREVAEWVRGQDYVFENCFGAGSGFVPPRAPADIDPLIQADRQYQIASALFYSSRYQDAASAFRRIASDPNSPWAGWGLYLAGRSLLWYARMAGEQAATYRGRLAQAESELRASINEDGAPQARDAARWLLARILMKTSPVEAATLLSGRLLSPLGAAARGRELHLLTQLMDDLEKNPGALAEVRAQVELIDWIFTFQQEDEAATQHAVARWLDGQSVAWLVAALSKVGPFDQAALDLLDSAAQVQGHPAKPTLEYYRARLHLERGEQQQAADALDQLLPQLQGLASSRNRALSMRASLGRGPQEILFFGVRPPAFASYVYWSDGSYISPWRLSPEERDAIGAYQNAMFWGPETAEILNGAVTVDALVTMLGVDGQPARLRTELLLAAWTRALLLERWDLVRALAERVGAAVPSMRADMQALLQVTALDRMRYLAARALLKTPGADILLHSGPIRTVPFDQTDPKGLNWWVVPPIPELLEYLPSDAQPYVAAEWNRIRAAGDGYSWLAREAIAEAEREAPDPSAPETLYWVVAGLDGVDLQWGHYRRDNEASALRSRAIELLRGRYPDSEWTRRAAEAFETYRW